MIRMQSNSNRKGRCQNTKSDNIPIPDSVLSIFAMLKTIIIKNNHGY